MNYIVDTCPLTKFEGGLNLLHEAVDGALRSRMAGIYSDYSTRELIIISLSVSLFPVQLLNC